CGHLSEGPDMTDRYFFSRDDTPFGPFSAGELRGLAASGQVRPTDPVWKEGSDRKVPAARVKNLFPALVPSPEPPEATPAPGARTAEPAPVGEPTPVRPALPADAKELVAPVPEPRTEPVERAAPDRPVPDARRKAEPEVRPKRVVGIKGAVLAGQDGVRVHFRKKCETCGYEDVCRTSVAIRTGAFRVPFFCRTCRRPGTVEIAAVGGTAPGLPDLPVRLIRGPAPAPYREGPGLSS